MGFWKWLRNVITESRHMDRALKGFIISVFGTGTTVVLTAVAIAIFGPIGFLGLIFAILTFL